MKLAFLCPDLVDAPHGGIPTVSRQLLRQLERIARERRVPLDYDVWALHDAPHDARDVAREVGLQTPPKRFRSFGGSRLGMLAAAARERSDADLVFTTHIGLGPVARLLRPRRVPVVQFLHGVECWRPLPAHQRVGIWGTNLLISNSAFTLGRFHDWNPEHRSTPSKVCWLGLSNDRAVDARGLRSDEPSYAPEDTGLSALIVGRIHPEERYKGHAELLAVWNHVRRQCPGARLDIVGDGAARPAYEAQAKRLGLLESGAVRFWGRIPDDELRALYQRTTVFAMPSRGEGFGLVYLEAMAAGVPCIGSLDDAAREVIVDGETGLSVRYGDHEGLARALVELFSDPAFRAHLGHAARARVLASFTEDHFGARIWDALAALHPRAFAAGTA
ncbi:glycosyltransferase family 4 protein [Polyangium sp. y55x31]|uniref:glycosyltransferase family 4 protein n=1 Tax=Polyangium sp. y55x31 TaxID=3042688 RepID=UPI00248238BD|nr:glycosyltransferase family 4 protein [Polyangium sp. y55x31]MDI1483027.1 glycosyltransferase family 4 protein [Polyangium sp. y55x31]